MRPIYNLDNVPPDALSFSHPYMIIGMIGCLFWAIAYILTIRRNKLEATYCLPAVAVCLNIGWELLTVFAFPDPVPAWRFAEAAWLVLDCVIVYQLFQFGPANQSDPAMARRFRVFCAGLIVLGLVGQYAFVAQYTDALGFVAGFFINLLMSASFIPFYFARRKTLRGISKGIAWTKMLGTVCTGYEAFYLIRIIDPSLPRIGFFEFLWAGIFVLDCLYLYYVYTLPDREVALTAPA